MAKKTKKNKFSFDEEIVIGLNKIEDPKQNEKSNENMKSTKESRQAKKNKKGVKQTKKNKNNYDDSKTKSNKKIKENKIKQNTKENKKRIKKQKPIEEKNLNNSNNGNGKTKKPVLKLIKWLTIIAIIIGGTIYALLSPIFNVKTISVIGNEKVSTDKVISLSKIELDQNMFKYMSKDIINNIKEDAYVEDVKVKRKFPDTFEITIKERKASFIIKVDNTYACINNQGYILEILESKNNLPVIIGAKTNLEQLFVGNRLLEVDLKRLNDVLKIMESATSNNLLEFISQIDITDKEDYIITMQNKNKNIHLGDISNLSTKMLWIIKFIEIEGNTAGEIMLNMNLNDEKNKPYFRVSI